MSGIGSYLKQTREALGYTLDQVQQSTKIHIEYLRALENDQFESLPSPFYVRAFLRTYAHSLGLDAQPLLDRYERFSVPGRTPGHRMTPQHRQGSGQSIPTTARNPATAGGKPRIGRTYSSQSQQAAASARQPQHPGGRQPFQSSKPPAQGTGSHQTTGPIPAPVSREQKSQRYQAPAGQHSTSAQGEVAAQSSYSPRRVAQEKSKGGQQEDGKSKKKKANWLLRIAAVVALVLVPVGVLASGILPLGKESADSGGKDQPDGDTGSGGTAKVDAHNPSSPTLQLVEAGSDMEGDLYTLEGADKIEIEIKANKGESQLRYGKKVNDNDGETFELKVGHNKKFSEKGLVWFRLSKPSNTEIIVNGQEIDTTAQDVPKSYRIQLEK